MARGSDTGRSQSLEDFSGLRGRYMKFNETRPSSLVYKLGRGGGYCAEMIGLLKVIQSCAANDLRLCVGENRGAKGYAVKNGWEEYYEPFMSVIPGKFLGVLNGRWRGVDRVAGSRAIRSAVMRTLYGSHRYFLDGLPSADESMAIADRLGISGDWWSVQRQLIDALWVYQPVVRSELEARREAFGGYFEPYVGVHIRRGDKSTEAPYTPLRNYVEILSTPLFSSMPVVLATDDARVGSELQDMLGAWREVRSLADSGEGHFQSSFNRKGSDVRRRETIRLLFELDILSESRFFVGAAPSNIFYWIRYRRGNQGIIDASDAARMQRVSEIAGDKV